MSWIDDLRIVHYPHPALRKRARPIETVDDEVRAVAARMIELLHQAPGLGLAAPQVGLSWRMFVTHVGDGEPGASEAPDRVYVNPVLVNPSRATEDHEEGCLSLPQIYADIRRPKGITLQAQDLAGQHVEFTSNQFEARVWQHEMDHLNGVLIIDRMAAIDKLANRKAIKDLEAAK